MAAKLQETPITKSDIDEYIQSNSDFSFEVQVLKSLRDLGLHCRHGEAYVDPQTDKYRDFDIRAELINGPLRLLLAVECKNLKEFNPLLMLCTPRQEIEAFHSVALPNSPPNDRSGGGIPYVLPAFQSRTVIAEVTSSNLYPIGEAVGRETSQVARRQHDKLLIGGDSETFDKWSQALSSCADLVESIEFGSETENPGVLFTIVVPILVVPDNMLWKAVFNGDGAIEEEAKQVDRCSYYLNRSYKTGFISPSWYTVSHLEFMTKSGLQSFIKQFQDDEIHKNLITSKAIEAAYEED